MSLEQKFTVFFFIFWFSFFISNIVIKVLFLIICCWFYRRLLNYVITIILFASLFWTVFYDTNQNEVKSPYCGEVVDFSETYVLLRNKEYQLSIFTEIPVNYNEKICVEGEIDPITQQSNFFKDPLMTWQQTNRHIGSINPTAIQKDNSKSTFKAKVYQKLISEHNTEWIINLLYSKQPKGNDLLLSLLFSSGIHYAFSLRWIRKMLSKIIVVEHAKIMIVLFWCLFRLLWGTSFIWWRIFFMVVCMPLIPNKKLGLVIGYWTLLLMFPAMHSHISFMLPMVLQMIFTYQKPNVIQRIIMMGLLQHAYLYSSNLLLIVGFGFIRYLSGTVYLFAWLLVVVPFLRKPFNEILNTLTSISTPRWATISGKLPLLLSVVFLMILLSKSFQSKKNQMILTLLITSCLIFWLYPPYDLVLFFNVGQADACLIRTKYNQDSFMIDVGRKSNSSLISQSLKGLGVRHLDAVILSHEDSDHAGGLDSLIETLPTTSILNKKMSYSFKTLDFNAINSNYQGVDENDDSLLGVVKVGDLKYLFLGDVYQQGERNLTQTYPNLKVDVLKVAHHGSKTSTSNILLSQIQAMFGVISSDPKVFGHPHDQVLKSLFNYRVFPLLTHQEGDIAFVRVFNIQFIITSSGRFGIIKKVIR